MNAEMQRKKKDLKVTALGMLTVMDKIKRMICIIHVALIMMIVEMVMMLMMMVAEVMVVVMVVVLVMGTYDSENSSGSKSIITVDW